MICSTYDVVPIEGNTAISLFIQAHSLEESNSLLIPTAKLMI